MPVTADELKKMNGASITELMTQRGITDDMLIDSLKEELAAIETKTRFNTDKEKWEYSKDLIAHEPRLRALELSFRLKGHLVERKHHTFEKPIPVQLTPEEELEVKAKMEVLKKKEGNNG